MRCKLRDLYPELRTSGLPVALLELQMLIYGHFLVFFSSLFPFLLEYIPVIISKFRCPFLLLRWREWIPKILFATGGKQLGEGIKERRNNNVNIFYPAQTCR